LYDPRAVGVFSDYLAKGLSFADLEKERKAQLAAISGSRDGRDILVYAADLNKAQFPISIDYTDLAPIGDQLANLKGDSIDVILETPGGAGEIAEDIVRLIHGRFRRVAFIVPGWAKSAGTIMVMSGHEILMGAGSALGPIDAQMGWQGRTFSAEAFLEGFKKIKEEVERTGGLNRAYVPILQGISPGELQNAEDALAFAKTIVTDWLVKFKFCDWNNHTDGRPVTQRQKRGRARAIANELCHHGKWLTHGRSLRISDLEQMRLQILDYDKQPALADAIARYHALLLLTFQTTLQSNVYKLIETSTSQIYRQAVAVNLSVGGQPQLPGPMPQMPRPSAVKAELQLHCNGCGANHRVQANLGSPSPLVPGCLPFPASNRLTCPNCGTEHDLTGARAQIEANSGLPVIPGI
jgi:hypothetical protein